MLKSASLLNWDNVNVQFCPNFTLLKLTLSKNDLPHIMPSITVASSNEIGFLKSLFDISNKPKKKIQLLK